jgi:predicted PurR-regulated permease PerM
MFARRVLLATFLVVAVLLGLFLLWQIQEIVILLLVAVIFGAAIRPAVLWLAGRGIPPTLSVLLIYFGLAVALGLILWLIVPPLYIQGRALVTALPGYLGQAQTRLADLVSGAGNLPFLPSPDDLASQLGGQLGAAAGGLAGRAFSLGVTAVGAIFSLFLLFVMTLYWLTEREHVIEHWLRLLPEARRAEVHATWYEIDLRLGAYVRGQLLLGVLIGVLCFIVLVILDIPYPLPLAVFAGMTELIPMIGPFLGAIPAVLIAFSIDPLHAGLVALAYLVIQQLEGNVLVPLVMRRAVGLSPLTVLIAIVVGTALLGVVGALLAVPVASIVSIILSHTAFRVAGPGLPPVAPSLEVDAAVKSGHSERDAVRPG